MSDTLHNYGLIRFSKRTGKIDTTMTAIGKGMIQLWALQNTPNSKACVLCDIDERKVIAEYLGTPDGFPKITKDPEDYSFNFPTELYEIFDEEVKKREQERK